MTLKEEALQAVEEVPEYKLDSLIQFARFLRYEAQLEENNAKKPRRHGGWIKGEIWMSDDFNDPMEFVSEDEARILEAVRTSKREAQQLRKAAV